MSVQSFLEQHHVFSLDEFRSELGEGRTAYNLLVRAAKRGLADRVVRAVYVSRAGKFAGEEPDPYLVAAKLAGDVVMVYHSALELHGLAHSPSRRVQFTTSRATATFDYRGFEFRRYQLPKALPRSEADKWTTLVGRPEGVARAATRERTLVDCMNRPDVSGGLEEVLRSLGGLPYVDATNVTSYLKVLQSPTAVARVGWLLEQRARDWYVSKDALNQMRSMLGKGPYYLSRANEMGTWVPSWRLYLPCNAAQLERWAHE